MKIWNQDQESKPCAVDLYFSNALFEDYVGQLLIYPKKVLLYLLKNSVYIGLLAQLFVIMVTQKSQGKNIKICTNTILNEFFKAQIKSNLNQVGESHLEGGGGMKARS